MAENQNQFKKHYNSFSGCDIRATFGAEVIGQLQGISWSVTREKAPIYTMGSPDPRAFSRGKRGIAGSLIFIQFDAHALLSSQVGRESFSDDKDALRVSSAGALINPANLEKAQTTFVNPRADQDELAPYYSDQILPFDVVLSAANEYGQGASMKIFGVEILNEGAGVSIDDIVLEQQMTFIARGCTGWQSK
jgi:hypothetical protein